MEKARLAAERAAARAAEEARAIDMNQPIPPEAFLWVEEEERLRDEEERLSVVRFAEATAATAAAVAAAAAATAAAAAAAAAVAEEEEREREREREREQERERLAQWARRREADREAEELENARILAEVVTTEKMTLKAKEEAEEEERARLLRLEEEENDRRLQGNEPSHTHTQKHSHNLPSLPLAEEEAARQLAELNEMHEATAHQAYVIIQASYNPTSLRPSLTHLS